MKAAWRILGAASLVWAASVSPSASLAAELLLWGGEFPEHAAPFAGDGMSPISDERVVATAFQSNCPDAADSCDDACDFDGCDVGYSCCAPVWRVRAGAVILTRDQPDGVILARPLGGLIQISGGEDFDFGYAAGPDVSIERMLGNGPNSVEFRYFGALDWTSSADYGNTGDIQIGPINIPLAFDVSADYFSRLNSAEFNFRHQHSDRVTWLAGFRYIELHEKVSYDVDFIVPNLSGVSWDTDNRLYGAQLGTDLKLWRLTGPLTMNGIFKAGLYGNDADNRFKYDILNIPIVEEHASDSPAAFVGEIGFTGAYQLTQHVALRGGYQLLWVNEVALASDQAQRTLNTLDADTIDASGNVFYHGALVGGEFVW